MFNYSGQQWNGNKKCAQTNVTSFFRGTIETNHLPEFTYPMGA